MEIKNRNFAQAMQAVLDGRMAYRASWDSHTMVYYDRNYGYVRMDMKNGHRDYLKFMSNEDFTATDWCWNE